MRRDLHRNKGFYENILPAYTIDEFKSHFRMTLGTFEALCRDVQATRRVPKFLNQEPDHDRLSIRRKRRRQNVELDSCYEQSTCSMEITSFSLNNFAPEKFFGVANWCPWIDSPKFSNETALWRRSLSNAITLGWVYDIISHLICIFYPFFKLKYLRN